MRKQTHAAPACLTMSKRVTAMATEARKSSTTRTGGRGGGREGGREDLPLSLEVRNSLATKRDTSQ